MCAELSDININKAEHDRKLSKTKMSKTDIRIHCERNKEQVVRDKSNSLMHTEKAAIKLRNAHHDCERNKEQVVTELL